VVGPARPGPGDLGMAVRCARRHRRRDERQTTGEGSQQPAPGEGGPHRVPRRILARTRVTTNSTSTSPRSTAAAPYPRWMYSGSPLRTAEKMNRGNEFIVLWRGSLLKKDDAPDTIRRGAVSPVIRAMPRISAVARPERAVGSTTRRTV